MEVACDLALKYDATLRLVHAYAPIFVEGMMSSADVEAVIAVRAQASDAILARAVARIQDRPLDLSTKVREALEAETHHCDLNVMGTRGLGQLSGLLLGGVSQKVVQHAKCPVLLVR